MLSLTKSPAAATMTKDRPAVEGAAAPVGSGVGVRCGVCLNRMQTNAGGSGCLQRAAPDLRSNGSNSARVA